MQHPHRGQLDTVLGVRGVKYPDPIIRQFDTAVVNGQRTLPAHEQDTDSSHVNDTPLFFRPRAFNSTTEFQNEMGDH